MESVLAKPPLTRHVGEGSSESICGCPFVHDWLSSVPLVRRGMKEKERERERERE